MPRTRNRRASFLPRVSRGSAVIVMSFLISYLLPHRVRDAVPLGYSLNEQGADRATFVDRLNRPRQQRRDRQHPNLVALFGFVLERYRVRHDYFMQPRFLDTLNGTA